MGRFLIQEKTLTTMKISHPGEDSQDYEDLTKISHIGEDSHARNLGFCANNALVISWIKLTVDPTLRSNLAYCEIASNM